MRAHQNKIGIKCARGEKGLRSTGLSKSYQCYWSITYLYIRMLKVFDKHYFIILHVSIIDQRQCWSTAFIWLVKQINYGDVNKTTTFVKWWQRQAQKQPVFLTHTLSHSLYLLHTHTQLHKRFYIVSIHLESIG